MQIREKVGLRQHIMISLQTSLSSPYESSICGTKSWIFLVCYNYNHEKSLECCIWEKQNAGVSLWTVQAVDIRNTDKNLINKGSLVLDWLQLPMAGRYSKKWELTSRKIGWCRNESCWFQLILSRYLSYYFLSISEHCVSWQHRKEDHCRYGKEETGKKSARLTGIKKEET